VEPGRQEVCQAKKAAKLAAEFYKLALPIIAKKKPANGFLDAGALRIGQVIPSFEERYQMKPSCIAVYPMYKGLAQLVGMTKLEGPQTISEQFERYLTSTTTTISFSSITNTPICMARTATSRARRKRLKILTPRCQFS
jgi:2,3-bisphosphoglycerate-independent phosphoglycerate mutase